MSEYKLMKWSELEATLPPEARARIDARFRETMSRMRLSDIREAVGRTQVELAAQLKLGQASLSCRRSSPKAPSSRSTVS